MESTPPTSQRTAKVIAFRSPTCSSLWLKRAKRFSGVLRFKEEPMSELIPWFVRTFPFPVPIELIPNLASRLQGTPARLEELLHRIDPDFVKARLYGRWSIQEHAGHLLDMEPLWISRVGDYAIGARELTPTDLQNKKTDDANHNANHLEEILLGFRDSRAVLLQRIAALSPSHLAGSIPHPRLRIPMNIADHLYFVAEHDDHHLATIRSLSTQTL